MKNYLFIVLVTLLVCCKNNKQTAEVPPVDTDTVTTPYVAGIDSSKKKNIFPASLENYWVYSTQHYKSDGTLEVDDSDSLQIRRIDTINGVPYYYFNPFRFRNKDWNTIAFYDKETNQEFDVKNNHNANNSLVKYVPYQTKPTCKYGVKLYLHKDRTVVNKFDCYKMNFVTTTCDGNTLSDIVLYISEGVGIVKAEQYQFDKGKRFLQTNQDLTAYKIN